MRAWLLLLCLVHSHLDKLCVNGKRFDPSMVDPLIRRSSLDKNFMRFGRSSPSFTEEDEVEDSNDSSPGAETSKEENFLRSMRGKQNFIRFGRARNENFMRFGRGMQDSFMRFGKARNDNFMRFGRGKQDNYMRFGRGKQDSYMRFGRGKQDNYMRFGRGKQDNYMRFGRGKQDNFMRFGRGKEDNFMRFGKGHTSVTNELPDISDKGLETDMIRNARGKQDNFMRFGKRITGGSDGEIAIAMRSGNPKGNSNFIRFGRARPDNFMRFGKSDDEKSSFPFGENTDESKDNAKDTSNYITPSNEEFARERKSKDFNLIRFERQPPNKNDGFMRFGRSSQEVQEENPQDTSLIPQRLKRSILKPYVSQDELYPSKIEEEIDNHVLIPLASLPSDLLEEEYSTPAYQEDYLSRRKRSLNYDTSTPPPFNEEDTSVDYISAKVRFDTPAEPEYQSSLFSAGLPNVIVGPEFSLLPDLAPPSTMLKRGRPGDQNFLRLG